MDQLTVNQSSDSYRNWFEPKRKSEKISRNAGLFLFYTMAAVYILYSQKINRYYIGFTTDLEVRLSFHKNSEARKFTAKADDWELFLEFSCESKSHGLKIERHIKNMKSKVYIENLKKYPEMIEKLKIKYGLTDC